MNCFETGKHCYMTPKEGYTALEKIQRTKTRSVKAKTSPWHGGPAKVYQCKHCNSWHIGHQVPSK